ncbi:Ribonucleoside-diphosphate reductase [Alicyclobacillus hesperidum URH17-3-68]|uniref:Ribonucleoside-diphosphate reductase subunit beta n=1 Tax=Alicyclobacillus hesperidum TaxID=89784 RepID=A0A1H2SRJ6_9BACL|nr:ribonucleotide-diphosphate reductase subunit beta [Alicyclobacillus hesperidum]EJY55114.1 Ribonucleoside-diphosphate reductase [Alicyclobacillus hesperidum URH17-3-68]SDW34220.1 ribonucleoside-diphosphate reductase beta chain [Alicyclobacillus hesperidum]
MKLERTRLFNAAGDRDWGKRRIIGGNTTNMIELNNIKYDWAYKLYRAMMNNFWIPEEIALADDARQYDALSADEQRSYNKVLSFLIFMDSLLTHNLPNINEYITAPEVNLCLTVHAFQEAVHSQSYGYILDSVVNAATRDAIYNEWREDEHLLRRNQFITDLFEQFIADPSDRNLLKTVVANYILEGVYFYAGFSFFFVLGRQGKMLGTVSEIKFIQRDELTHLAIFRNLYHEIIRENKELLTPELEQEFLQMMRTAVDHEVAWGQYVTGGKIAGLTDVLIDQYIKYLANIRLLSLNLPILYPEITEHPMPWLDSYASMNSMKTDFFEQRVTSYTKAGNLNWDEL